ncbi:MAG: M66 family metalloprotease [Myxococcales bacterium]|jgi:hypothetical protein
MRRIHRGRAHAAALSIAALLACAATACDDGGAGGGDAPASNPAATGTSSGPVVARACVPGQVSACDCGGSASGIAVCDRSGQAFGACQCPAARVMTGAGVGALPTGGAGTTGGPDGQAGAAGATGSAGGAPDGPTEPVSPPGPVLARDIRIRELALFQAVKVPLARDGAAVIERNAPVVVGKEALLRIYVETLPGFAPREIAAVLTLSAAEAPTEPQRIVQRIDGSSREESLDSTINFELPAGTITADLLYSVALHEVGDTTAAGDASAPAMEGADPAARFPEQDGALAELGARDAGPLRVVVVPYRYTADGSGRLPVVDDAQLQLFRDYIYAYYPITDLELSVHDPVDYAGAVGPNTGWETWLDDHCALRTAEQPDPKVIYYGLMAPRTDARSYGGGVVGISYLPGPAANFGRCSVGVGFEGAIAASTMAHELGHSLGLPHAPCGVDGGPYPYPDASIGVWGFGLSSRTLKDPEENYDLMSYCNPVFISDYNFQKLFERVRYLNLQFRVQGAGEPAVDYLRVLQTPDGRRRVTGRLSMRGDPGGDEERRAIELLDARGASMGAQTGWFFPSSEAGGGLWLLPDRGARAAVLGGRRLVLP